MKFGKDYFCPFCHKIVAHGDPERIYIPQTDEAAHGDCYDKAVAKTQQGGQKCSGCNDATGVNGQS